uniref:Reverse transcriptase zinc-binding domain-containing protein n=2 Tax=Aegilops tauschii subsp. strangulata TaxID=200361 RepID=A0A453DYT1_AEGTS
SVQLGNGKSALFWTCNWIESSTLHREFPTLFQHSRRKNRTVEDALTEDKWVRDLRHGNTAEIALEFLQMWRKIQGAGIVLSSEEDKISWVAGRGGGSYSARAAYNIQTNEVSSSGIKAACWKAWAPGTVKIFAWLLLKDRLWCNDRLQRRGWPNGYFCTCCNRNLESSTHLFWDCPFARSVWQTASSRVVCAALKEKREASHSSLRHWERLTALTPQSCRKGFRTMLLLITWELWKERNACVFRGKMPQTEDVQRAIRGTLELWRLAGARCLQPPFGEDVAR